MSAILWGLDLGGTKIEGAVIDPAHPTRPLARLRRETGAHLGYNHVVSQIVGVVGDLQSATGTDCPPVLGIGTPGDLDPESGLLRNSNSVCLNGRPLRSDLQALLGREVRIANDANCCALAEATLGAASGCDVVFGVILGTGCGGGLVVHGRVLRGAHGIAGEWGHNPLRGETTPCYCGQRGCVETVLAGPSLERFYRENGGEAVRLPEIARRAAAGEVLAEATLRRLREKFAEAIAAVINIVDPDAIVIGGGVGNLEILYSDETRALIRDVIFHDTLKTRILRPALGDSAGVFGAAMLCRPARA